ncbi:MAG: hypothetical protein LBT65_04955 [Synergistaceae bacterium]|jgi:hypothetical protein|nr:hypothetical protein [Synergistaceae bacterium]
MKAQRPFVYIPFEDGSVVAFDGKKFTIHKRPVDIDADLDTLSDGQAALAWRERRGEIVRALEAAWWKLEERRRQEESKKVYSDSQS